MTNEMILSNKISINFQITRTLFFDNNKCMVQNSIDYILLRICCRCLYREILMRKVYISDKRLLLN